LRTSLNSGTDTLLAIFAVIGFGSIQAISALHWLAVDVRGFILNRPARHELTFKLKLECHRPSGKSSIVAASRPSALAASLLLVPKMKSWIWQCCMPPPFTVTATRLHCGSRSVHCCRTKVLERKRLSLSSEPQTSRRAAFRMLPGSVEKPLSLRIVSLSRSCFDGRD
jgi:hypothetical protein